MQVASCLREKLIENQGQPHEAKQDLTSNTLPLPVRLSGSFAKIGPSLSSSAQMSLNGFAQGLDSHSRILGLRKALSLGKNANSSKWNKFVPRVEGSEHCAYWSDMSNCLHDSVDSRSYVWHDSFLLYACLNASCNEVSSKIKIHPTESSRMFFHAFLMSILSQEGKIKHIELQTITQCQPAASQWKCKSQRRQSSNARVPELRRLIRWEAPNELDLQRGCTNWIFVQANLWSSIWS